MFKTQWNTQFYNPVLRNKRRGKIVNRGGRPDRLNREDIIRVIKLGATSTDAIADEVGFSYDSVRKHLYAMQHQGLITATRPYYNAPTVWGIPK